MSAILTYGVFVSFTLPVISSYLGWMPGDPSMSGPLLGLGIVFRWRALVSGHGDLI